MSNYLVTFFDLKNNWADEMNVMATSQDDAKNKARKIMGRGFVNFRAF